MNYRQITAAAALGTAALAFLPGATHAQTTATVDFAAAGSSAQFNTFTGAFITAGYGDNSAGTGHYTYKSSSNFQILDTTGGLPENAQIAIYWKGGGGSNYSVAVFYQVDSTVGCRAYFNSDTLSATSTPPTGGNLGQPGSGDTAPPAAVLAAVNGAMVNVGATDITPEDAEVATQRSIGLGYSTTNPILSGVAGSTAKADPVPFSITSKPFTLVPLGAVPIVVFVNNGPGFSQLTGANLNIDSFQLAGFLSGQFDSTADLLLSTSAPDNPVHTYVREPLSGTYNTMEYCNAESLGKLAFTQGKPSGSQQKSGGQELNVNPLLRNGNPNPKENPLNEPVNGTPNTAPSGSGRIRAVGTGELVGAVNRDSVDALGYAFYSVGTFNNLKDANGAVIPTVLKYLTVDGADPILDSYNGGSIQNQAATFRNIKNGGYPLWSILRVIEPQNASTAITSIVGDATGQAQGTDFVNYNSLLVFRSYHQTAFTQGGAGNGHNGLAASGGDVGGAVFSINNDVDAVNDTGSDLSNQRQ